MEEKGVEEALRRDLEPSEVQGDRQPGREVRAKILPEHGRVGRILDPFADEDAPYLGRRWVVGQPPSRGFGWGSLPRARADDVEERIAVDDLQRQLEDGERSGKPIGCGSL